MKFKVPDDINTYSEDEAESNSNKKELKKSFQQEILEILQLPTPLSTFLTSLKSIDNSAEDKLKMFMKFSEFCRQEVIPRRNKAIQAIELRSDELRCQLKCQQKDLAHLSNRKQEIFDTMFELEIKRKHAQNNHNKLSKRLKEVLPKLQDNCKTRTLAEKKMAQDMVNLEAKVSNLYVYLKETSSKVNYYTTQVKVQTDMVQKKEKPLYLDKNRVVFIKSNLNTMRQNIEQLVCRVKALQTQTSDLQQEHSESVCTDLS